MADEKGTAEQAVVQEQVVEVDLRSIILGALRQHERFGLSRDEIVHGALFGYGGVPSEIRTAAELELSTLEAEGLVNTRRQQIGTAGTEADFYVLAPHVRLTYKTSSATPA